MKPKMRIAAILILALLVFLPVRSASASTGAFDGQVIFGQSYLLESGETLNGDLLVFGGSAVIEEGATVNGNAVVFGGSLTIDGEVMGDAAVFGGSASLGATSHIHGGLSTVGSTIEQAEGAQIDGTINNTSTSVSTNGSTVVTPVVVVPTPLAPIVPQTNSSIENAFRVNFGDPFLAFWNAIATAFVTGVLAMLVMLFLAQHADRVAHAIFAQPLTAGGIGLLTLVGFPVAVVVLALASVLVITLFVTIPAMIVLPIALGVACLFGWISIGYEIGQRFTRAIHQEWHPAFTAGLGTFALTLVARLLSSVCLGAIVPFLVGAAALGAVIITRFGTRSVESVKPAAVVPTEGTGPNPIP